MKLFNSIELINDDKSHVLSFVALFSTFTLSFFFSIPLYVLSEENSIYIFLANGFFLILYVFSSVFFKNALKVLSKELFGFLLFSMVLFLSYFYYGYEIIGNLRFLFLFLFIFIFIDYIIFYKKNNEKIYGVIEGCLDSASFNYAYREECRINIPIEKSFLSNIVLIIICLILPFLLVFGKSLPYVFFGLFGGNADADYLIVGIFIILLLLLLFLLSYIYLFILYLYYFLKIVYLRRHELKNLE